MKGFGVPHFGKTGKGSQYVRITVDIPKKLTKKQRDIVKQLSEEGL